MSQQQPGFETHNPDSSWRVIYEDPETRKRESIILTGGQYLQFCEDRDRAKGYDLVPITVKGRFLNLPKNGFKGEVELPPKKTAIAGREHSATFYDMCKWSPEELKDWAYAQSGVLAMFPIIACGDRLMNGLSKSVFNMPPTSTFRIKILDIGKSCMPEKKAKVVEPEVVAPKGTDSFSTFNQIINEKNHTG